MSFTQSELIAFTTTMTTEEGNGIGIQTNNGNGHKSDTLTCSATTTTTTTNLASRLFNTILLQANGSKDGNLIISPLLLEATLALLYLGSDGATAEQLQRLLQLNKRYANNAKMANYYATQLAAATTKEANSGSSSSSSNGSGSTNIEATVAATTTAAHATSTHVVLFSRIFMPENYEISDEFCKIAQKYFYTIPTTTTKTTTESTKALKEFGEKEYANATTKATDSTAILFVAANFENKWFLPFSAYRTGLYDFYMVDVNAGQMDDNHQVAKPIAMLFDDDMFVKFAEFRELDARAIELPYEWDGNGNRDENMDDELSMLLVLPNQRDGLARLEAQLCETDLMSLTERMQMESVQVLLPKFRIDFECSLRHCLEQLEVSTIFSKEANFKNLLHENCQKPLQFENVIHKCCIEVNESGSAQTKSVGGALKPIVISNSLNGRQKFFRADHPFFFAIRTNDAIYFMGQVTSF